MSVLKTIETIDFCCMRSAYSDAYVLIRKCRDDLLLFLFIWHVMKNNSSLSVEDIDGDVLKPETWTKLLEKYFSLEETKKNKEVEIAVGKWATNDLNKRQDKKAPDYMRYFGAAAYKKYLTEKNNDVRILFEKYLSVRWNSETVRLNNYVHANGLRYVYDNYSYGFDKRKKDLEVIESLQNVIDIFFATLAIIDGSVLRSSDYIDALEMGIDPIEGSQYWVPLVIDEYINERFSTELLTYIREKDVYGMEY